MVQHQMRLREKVVTHGKGEMDFQIELLVNMYRRLESLDRLRVHLAVLIGDRQFIPGQHILGPQLLLQVTVRTAVLVERIPEHDRILIDLSRRFVDHLVDADALQRLQRVSDEATWRGHVLARDRRQERVLSLVRGYRSILSIWCRVKHLVKHIVRVACSFGAHSVHSFAILGRFLHTGLRCRLRMENLLTY